MQRPSIGAEETADGAQGRWWLHRGSLAPADVVVSNARLARSARAPRAKPATRFSHLLRARPIPAHGAFVTSIIPPTIDRGDHVIAVIGDWHGSLQWGTQTLQAIGEAGIRTALHVGDFGLGRAAYSNSYMDALDRAASAADVHLWVTDGNHEDHSLRLELLAASQGQPAQLREHIWLLPRGYRWTHADRSFVSLGGAPSINFLSAAPGSWYPDELITDDDVACVIAGGHADVMIAHDSPSPATPAVERIRSENPGRWPSVSRAYAAEGAYKLTQAYRGATPDLLFHGHLHVHDEVTFDDGSRIISVNMNGSPRNVARLDLTDMSTSWVELPPGQRTPRQLITWADSFRTPVSGSRRRILG